MQSVVNRLYESWLNNSGDR